MAVYLSCIYSDVDAGATFKEKYKATGKRCDVDKSCVRFKKLEHLPLELIGEYIGSHTMESWISLVDSIFKERKAQKKTRKEALK